MRLVRAAVADHPDDGAADLLRLAGRTLVSSVGGASGPLYGTLFLEAGGAFAAPAGPRAIGDALEAGAAGVARRGRSTVGQKTMLDTLVPAAAVLVAALRDGAALADAVQRAAEAAAIGCESTRPMIAQRGRASYLGERAIGHLDPGAVSSRILVDALAAASATQDRAPASSAPRR